MYSISLLSNVYSRLTIKKEVRAIQDLYLSGKIDRFTYTKQIDLLTFKLYKLSLTSIYEGVLFDEKR
jgi:hypothetical protein